MKVSVVINASKDSANLRQTLLALRRQTYHDFEVIVVTGPSADSLADLRQEFGGAMRTSQCPETHAGKARNCGTALASGEVIAFIDDNAIPSASWLEELAAGYDSEHVAGVGGLVCDPQGNSVTTIYNRRASASANMLPPYWGYSLPHPDRFLSLPGCNVSFRRRCLEEVGGFDEELESDLDTTDLCMRVLDQGHELRLRTGAVVYRQELSSCRRTELREALTTAKDRLYFTRSATLTRLSLEAYIEEIHDSAARILGDARTRHAAGTLAAEELASLEDEVDRVVWVGIGRGLHGKRKVAALAPARVHEFQLFPTLRPAPQALTFCFVSAQQSPGDGSLPAGFPSDLARGFADQGHEVHVLTPSSEQYRIDFADGVWIHGLLPETDGPWCRDGLLPRTRADLGHAAAVHREVRRIGKSRVVDLVSIPLGAAGLFCLLDSSLTCVLSLERIAVACPGEPSHHLPKVEQLALRAARYVHAPNRSVLDTIRRAYGFSIGDGVEFIGAAEVLPSVDSCAHTLHAYVDLINRRKAA